MKLRKVELGLIAALLMPSVVFAGSLPLLPSTPTQNEPSQTVNTLNQLINTLNGATPGVPGAMASFAAPVNPRNMLDNGQMAVQQRGTGAATCGTTTITSAAYAPDRWLCDVNVGSGAGQLTPLTTGLPPGFVGGMKLARNSGALLQPQCVMQEIPNQVVVANQGQPLTFSMYAQALAGMTAANNAVTVNLWTGTTSDEGIIAKGPTATPAITIALTGLVAATPQTFNLTSTWARYVSTPIILPTTAVEAVLAICTTPVGTASGATDGFAVTGAQLEAGTGASAFEFRSFAEEQRIAQRYFFTLTEPAAAVPVAVGYSSTTTAGFLTLQLPVTMRIAPTISFSGTALSASTWKVGDAASNIALSTPYLAAASNVSTPNVLSITATTGATQTAGHGITLVGAAGGSILNASAEF